jgi:hypothetical protein
LRSKAIVCSPDSDTPREFPPSNDKSVFYQPDQKNLSGDLLLFHQRAEEFFGSAAEALRSP